MKLSINAPSYKRPGGVDTLKYIPGCRIWVCETEAGKYRKANPKAKIIGVPKGVQGNVSRIRNYILDQEYDRGVRAVAIVDDDLQWFGFYEGREHRKIPRKEVVHWMKHFSRLAMDWGVKLWGVNCNSDYESFREYTPFGLTVFIGSPFTIHINSPLRYDERLPLKEDYDLTLQHLNQFRKALRVNKYHYNVKQGGSGSGQSGGCAVYRNVARELSQLKLLQKKWGSKIVRIDLNENSKSKKGRKIADINPIIKVPIRGI